jgi:hypothetical protein
MLQCFESGLICVRGSRLGINPGRPNGYPKRGGGRRKFHASKSFLFSIFLRYQRNRWCTLSCQYLREFSKKFETALMVYSGAWGKLIHEKTRSRKSRETVPLIIPQIKTLFCRRVSKQCWGSVTFLVRIRIQSP